MVVRESRTRRSQVVSTQTNPLSSELRERYIIVLSSSTLQTCK